MSKKIFTDQNTFVFASDEYNIESLPKSFLWLKDYVVSGNITHTYTLDYDDMITRCRYLRNIEETYAVSLIDKIIIACERMLLDNKIDIIYSIPIDSYILHCLYIVAESNKIKFFSFVGTLFKDRIRITNFGELVKQKAVKDDKEVIQTFIDEVKRSSIRPDWLIGVSNTFNKTVITRFILDFIKPVAFFIYRIRYRDYTSFSFPKYKLLKVRMFSTFPRLMAAKRIEKKSVDPELLGKFIFIPLQFYPEITSDYWIRNLELCNHHKVVLKIIDSLPSEQTFVVKEHPAAAGRRDENFLLELHKRSNVTFAPLKYPMNSLIKKADLVIGNASTTTINALILQKPVIFFAKPYFPIPKPSYFKSLETDHIKSTVELYRTNVLNDNLVFKIVEDLFEGSCEGNLGGYIPLGEKSKVGDVKCNDKTRSYVHNYLQ